jgi:hypothetical protein
MQECGNAEMQECRNIGYRMHDTGYRMHDTGYGIRDAGLIGHWIFNG